MKHVTVYDYDELKQMIADHCNVEKNKVDVVIDGMIIEKHDFTKFEIHVEEKK